MLTKMYIENNLIVLPVKYSSIKLIFKVKLNWLLSYLKLSTRRSMQALAFFIPDIIPYSSPSIHPHPASPLVSY